MNTTSHLLSRGSTHGQRAIVQRPALAHVSDRALTSVMGRVHEYGDRRLPLPGALGITAAALAAVTAAIAGNPGTAAAAGTAVAAQALWLIIYLRISAPINHTLTQPPRAGTSPPMHAPCSTGGMVSSPHAPSCRRPPSPRCVPHSPFPSDRSALVALSEGVESLRVRADPLAVRQMTDLLHLVVIQAEAEHVEFSRIRSGVTDFG
jgi:hypothetical protein